MNTFPEEYQVKFNLKKPDGYWEYGLIETITVPVVHGVNEKNNHKAAEDLIKDKFPGCVIVSVVYC